MLRRFTMLFALVALAACADAVAPTHDRVPPSVRDRINLLQSQVSPRPAGADTLDRSAFISFTVTNPCTGDTVVVSGQTHEQGWTYDRPDTVDRDTRAAGENGLTAIATNGQRYDVIYYNQQRLHQEKDSAGVWHTTAHVHKLWFLVHGVTWKTYLVDQEYSLASPPWSFTSLRNDNLCGDF